VSIGEKFSAAARRGQGCAVILAGSDSDRPHIDRIVESLEEFQIPYEVRVCSAHKSPERLLELIAEYERLAAPLAYIAVAGGADALSGTLSFHALSPVISCPPDGPNPSCLANPPGSSNATIYHPKNVGKFLAQMYAAFNSGCAERLRRVREEKIARLEAADREFRDGYGRGS
jgi:phosphoribosylaminoimidazole carboxylase PurE protein